MKKLSYAFLILTFFSIDACRECQTCIHYEGGVAGGSIIEEKKVCNEKEALELEKSSSNAGQWFCD